MGTEKSTEEYIETICDLVCFMMRLTFTENVVFSNVKITVGVRQVLGELVEHFRNQGADDDPPVLATPWQIAKIQQLILDLFRVQYNVGHHRIEDPVFLFWICHAFRRDQHSFMDIVLLSKPVAKIHYAVRLAFG